MTNNNWIAWNYKSKTNEIVEYVIDEVNNMLKDNKIKKEIIRKCKMFLFRLSGKNGGPYKVNGFFLRVKVI